tara:strand:- start:98070 stop:98870 length:801 start_codon:yes stop_codon:yes gene_type:complete
MRVLKIDLFGRRYLTWTLIVMIGADLVLLLLFLIPGVAIDKKIGIGVFTSVPLFILAILQLARNYRVQRAQYIKDFLMEFRRNKDLVDSYYDLIYSYRDELYEKVKECAEDFESKLKKKDKRLESADKPVFDIFDNLQNGRSSGNRLYYPPFFHFSDEERRLDGVLDFFNSLAYYWHEGLVSVEEITNTLGDYLVVISERKVIQDYLDFCNDSNESKYRERFGSTTAYLYLGLFLEHYRHFNFETSRQKEIESLKHAIEKAKKRKP